MNRTFNPKNSGHIVDKVKMSELDDAIGRYCEQWGEPEPEPLYDVLENVSDRFHFRHDNFIVCSGQPKRTFLPFYSHAGNVFDLARNNDPKALEIVDNMAYDLATMFSFVGHIVDPQVIVIGGGVMTKAKDVFFDKMEKNYRGMIHPGMQPVKFVEAELEEPGIIGAAMLPMADGK